MSTVFLLFRVLDTLHEKILSNKTVGSFLVFNFFFHAAWLCSKKKTLRHKMHLKVHNTLL